MSNVHPLLQEALEAVCPDFTRIEQEAKARKETVERLHSTLERNAMQRLIEDLIVKLHPDGLEAAEILAALTVAVKSRYDNQLVTEARIDEYGSDLSKTFERAYEAA